MVGVTTALVALGLAGPAAADVPQNLVHQGRLFDTAGVPLDKDIDAQFALYSVATGGTAVWTEVHTLAIDDGYFSVELGGVNFYEIGGFECTGADGFVFVDNGLFDTIELCANACTQFLAEQTATIVQDCVFPE